MLDEIGLPPGVVNMVHGGAEIANGLMEHPDIKGVTFVGSTPVGRHVYKKCGETGKRVIAQAGAKNFIVIMPDAEIDKAMVSLMSSFFGNTGQRCLSGANLLVVGDDKRYREVSVQMGPVQNVESKQRIIGMIEKGIEEGAKLTLDGRKLNLVGDVPEDCFLNPSVFENVTLDMTIAREEIFGPVASILRAGDLDEAIDMIHQIPYGNS
ncbi:MAG: aldehyde dehydrogenase family protein, partial [Deltaproteobacteria bacterium]|nr:aldehyde dehydrogenase family protein [Deltaproteobacteria bacterium]